MMERTMVSTVVEAIKGIILVAAGTKARQRRDKAAAAARVAEEAAKEEENRKTSVKRQSPFQRKGLPLKPRYSQSRSSRRKRGGRPRCSSMSRS